MLNDLLAFERGLSTRGVSVVGRHPDIKDMAKGPAIRVRLAEDGAIVEVRIIEQAGQGAVWTLRDGQHNGFPGLKTASGLLNLSAEEQARHDSIWAADKTWPARRAELRRLFSSFHADLSSPWPNAGHRRRIAERLAKLKPLAGDRLAKSVPAAFERFLLAVASVPSFLENLKQSLAERVENGTDEWLELVRTALVGPIALVMDVDADEFQRDACDPRQVDTVSAALSDPEEASEAIGSGTCSLTGELGALHAGNFPQPNLPGLGQTYLFSRNRDIPSLSRYRRTAGASFPIGAVLVRRLSGAIGTLTRADAEGKTWRLIPAETGDKRDLMIVSFADPSLALANAMTKDDDDEEVEGEAALVQLASSVVKQSEGRYEQDYAQDQMTILVLRTVDPANRKSIYQRSTSPQAFFEAAKKWHEATSNTPEWIEFHLPVKGASGLAPRRPPRVGPLSIIPLSKVLFANGGRRRIPVIGIPASEAFALFLEDGDFQRLARGILDILLRRHGPLLAGVAHARTKGGDALKSFDQKTDLRRGALSTVAWLGVLLHRLGRTKEVYMSDAAFKLGQLLNAADLVHVGYCADLRGGDVPPSLLGNSVLSIAAGNPMRAVSILCNRWKPYGAWARQSGRISRKIGELMEGKDKARAWSMRQGLSTARRVGPLAAELASYFSADGAGFSKPDDRFRTELLLGYMAGLDLLPKKEGPTDDDQANSEGENK